MSHGSSLNRREFVTRVGLGAAGLATAGMLGAWDCLAAEPPAGPRNRSGMVMPQPPLSVVPGRPTDRAIALSLLASAGGTGLVGYGRAPGQYGDQPAPITCAANAPVDIVLDGLQPDTEYFYRVQLGDRVLPEQRFHTQRAPGSTFTFQVQGDSHPERPQMFDAALYAQTLRAAAADRPDFYVTIGDDFSVDWMRTAATPDQVDWIYRNQRAFLSLIGAPVFLVNGNHEQAAMCNLDGTPNNVAVWAGTCRNRYFALPSPDSFYSGDVQPVANVGLLRDYYAWTWGDALFVVIDPYWHSPEPVDNVYGGGPKGRNLWAITLGDVQYEWLAQTLQRSRAKYKFVFSHHVLGTGRGGIEEAGLCEWGGYSRRGDWQFTQWRPGWQLPIHQLMVKHGVTIFFQGHDHVFVKQQLDGIVYQTLPLPADPYYAFYNREAYQAGDALPNSGRLRVTVSSEKVSVAYVRSVLPRDETAARRDGEIAHNYEVHPVR